jgi:nucleoside-diphosphate-sugar epimerase
MYAKRGLKVLRTRFSSVYGIGREVAPVNLFTRKAIKGEEISIFGPEVTRDYTHVSDVVRGVRGLLEHEDVEWNGQCFNIASGKPTKTIEVLLTIEDFIGAIPKKVLPAKKGDVLQNYFDITKIKELGFKPHVGLREGINELIEYYEAEEL